jgi:hypothetical protein
MPAPPIVANYSAPSSVLAKNLITLRKMLANCTAFRTFAGATNEAEALARIYLGCLPLKDANDAQSGLTELNNFRPFAIIGPVGNPIERRHISTGQVWSHGRRGEAMILMERQHPASGNDDVNDLAWMDLVDTIVQSNNVSLPGLVELHESQEYLSLSAVDVLEIYRGLEEEKAELGDYQRAEIKVHWGRI